MISSGIGGAGILIYVVPAATLLAALYWVIRSAVGSALRRHQIWLDVRNNLPPGPTGAIDAPHE